LPFTFIGDWQNQVDHLLWQEGIKQRPQQPSVVAAVIRDIADEHQCEEESEFASPGDFMPLPTQWEMHAQYVGRYGSIDVFYFDFYSIALSKIERGNSRDIADVKLLVQKGIIKLDELDVAYQQVLVQLGQGRYPRLTPERFVQRYAAVRQLL
jgi:hypothetical protein